MSTEHAPARARDSGGKVYLTSRQVRARYGNVTDMSLWRWQNDPELNFPQPLRINRRRLWDLSLLERFEAEQASRGAA